MPIPFILGAAALLAGGYGIKKVFDAKSDFDTAQCLNNRAQEIFDEAQKKLELAREQAKSSMDALGKLKFDIYENSLIPFVERFSRIKNVDFSDNRFSEFGELVKVSASEMQEIQRATLQIKEVVGGGIAALGAGGLAGIATYGGAGLLASASSGTAIATLHGAAAANATLAWFGGGSLAAGGFGMAGGTMILGGIVAGPVLAVGGMMLASKAEAAKHDAYANFNKARIYVEEFETATERAKAIQYRFDEIYGLLDRLNVRLKPLLVSLASIVDRSYRIRFGVLFAVELILSVLGTSWIGLIVILFIGFFAIRLIKIDYHKLTSLEKKELLITCSIAKTLKNIVDTPLIDQDGSLTLDSGKIIESGEGMLKSLVGNPSLVLTNQSPA